MVSYLEANASPEKRLFISLITRDISVVSALLDLIDNSINAAVEPFSGRLRSADDYQSVSLDTAIVPQASIDLSISADAVTIEDTAGGISAKMATDHVFKFGRAQGEVHVSDRLSVYGIGLKRAMFKLGNRIDIRSDHREGGFSLQLDVGEWSSDISQPWKFVITRRPPSRNSQGTLIKVTQLYDDVARRIKDGLFMGQMRDAISRTYSFYMEKFVLIRLNDSPVEGLPIALGRNKTSDSFRSGGVTCNVTAGIGISQGGGYRDRSAGWFVFCNGRTVISADKSPLTGWGTGATGLPIFQPKHRPFFGMVFFVAEDAEQLPWTTTKASINEDSSVWQEAKRYMSTVGREVVSFLDGRYTDEGTEVSSSDLKDVAGERMSVIAAAVSEKQSFRVPTKPKSTTIRVQYDARVDDIKRIEKYVGRLGMGAAEVGRYTFDHFLRNEVES